MTGVANTGTGQKDFPAFKIADALNVSLGYLIGKTHLEFDGDTLKRIEEISKMSDKNKEMIYTFLDSFLATNKMQSMLKK